MAIFSPRFLRDAYYNARGHLNKNHHHISALWLVVGLL